MEKRSCVMKEGPAVDGKNQEEDETVSMPRRNKIEIFVDENRMSPRWKKGQLRGSWKERAQWNVSRVRQRKRENGTERRSSEKAVEVQNRGKKRDAYCGRTEKETDRSPFFSFFFLSRSGKRIGK